MTEKAIATKTALAPVPVKTLEAEDVVERFESIYDAIARRAFEIFDNSGRFPGHDLEHWLQAESEILHPVNINMSKTDDGLAVQAELPGFTAKDLQIQVEPRRLTISAKGRLTRSRRREGPSSRSINRTRS